MLLWALIFIFWSLVPGLITGWMFRERGRNFAPGFLTGAVFGPLGILGALVFIYAGDRKMARGRAKGRGRAVRVFYEIPVVGRLHVSTVWALAGLATFLCLWMVGGVFYELQRTDRDADPAELASGSGSSGPAANALTAGSSANDSRAAGGSAAAQANTSSQPKSAILGNLPGQTAQTGSGAQQAPPASSQGAQPLPNTPGASGSLNLETNVPQPSSPATAAPEPPAPTPTARDARQSREAALSEVMRDLASMGHRAHAAMSGAGRSTTLSLSGASLTREAGSRLLGNARTREALKAAGVRVVVLVNGEQSWTFIL